MIIGGIFLGVYFEVGNFFVFFFLFYIEHPIEGNDHWSDFL
jgi:hypothetical protein